MSETLFVSFGHRKRVGKDTAAKFLKNYLMLNLKNSNIVVKGFADKGKDICFDLFNWAGMQPGWFYEEQESAHLKDEILPSLGKSPRTIWIDFMSKAVREQVFDMTWVEYLLNTTECQLCIIKDLRFPVEAEAIKSIGGLVYRIDRADAPNDSDIADDALIGYEGWTGVIDNNGSLAEFNKKIEALGMEILEKIVSKQNIKVL